MYNTERKTRTVHIDYHVEFDNHLYSVPFTLIHQKVDIRATEKMVEIFHQGKTAAIHPRNYLHGRFSTLQEQMPANHQFMADINSDRLIEWAGSIEPQASALVKATLHSRTFPEQAYRTSLGILGLAKKHSQANMETACQIACEAKVFSSKAVE